MPRILHTHYINCTYYTYRTMCPCAIIAEQENVLCGATYTFLPNGGIHCATYFFVPSNIPYLPRQGACVINVSSCHTIAPSFHSFLPPILIHLQTHYPQPQVAALHSLFRTKGAIKTAPLIVDIGSFDPILCTNRT